MRKEYKAPWTWGVSLQGPEGVRDLYIHIRETGGHGQGSTENRQEMGVAGQRPQSALVALRATENSAPMAFWVILA